MSAHHQPQLHGMSGMLQMESKAVCTFNQHALAPGADAIYCWLAGRIGSF